MGKFLLEFAPVVSGLLGIVSSFLGLFADTLAFDGALKVNWPWWSTMSLLRIGAYAGVGILLKKLHHECQTDSLTGIANRRHFNNKLSEEIERIRKTSTPLSLVLIDVDDFKNINDRYGHHAGDETLKQLAYVLRKNTRSRDTVARWGGEEFVVILPDTIIEGALALAERLRSSVETSPYLYNTTISLGVISSDRITNAGDFLRQADRALYRAKEKKNAIEIA